MKRKLNLKTPILYSEKIQWIKLYDRKQEYITFVDKYRVRKYIARTIGEEYLIPTIAVFRNVEEINWDELPNQFVLKCNHASTTNIICRDKNKLDIEVARQRLKKWLKINWFWYGREWAYKHVKPVIVCEKFISDTGEIPDDYKVICFNGKAKIIEVHHNRYKNHQINVYDADWNETDIYIQNVKSDNSYPRPDALNEMLRLSEILAKETFTARVDWYIVSGKLFFGEITLYEASGFVCKNNLKTDQLLGSWIKLT